MKFHINSHHTGVGGALPVGPPRLLSGDAGRLPAMDGGRLSARDSGRSRPAGRCDAKKFDCRYFKLRQGDWIGRRKVGGRPGACKPKGDHMICAFDVESVRVCRYSASLDGPIEAEECRRAPRTWLSCCSATSARPVAVTAAAAASAAWPCKAVIRCRNAATCANKRQAVKQLRQKLGEMLTT